MTLDDALAILGLDQTATLSQRRHEYQRLLRFWDPQQNRASEAPTRYMRVRAAWAFLQDYPPTGGVGETGPQGPEGPQGPPGVNGPWIFVQNTEPTSPAIGDLWIDTSL